MEETRLRERDIELTNTVRTICEQPDTRDLTGLSVIKYTIGASKGQTNFEVTPMCEILKTIFLVELAFLNYFEELSPEFIENFNKFKLPRVGDFNEIRFYGDKINVIKEFIDCDYYKTIVDSLKIYEEIKTNYILNFISNYLHLFKSVGLFDLDTKIKALEFLKTGFMYKEEIDLILEIFKNQKTIIR